MNVARLKRAGLMKAVGFTLVLLGGGAAATSLFGASWTGLIMMPWLVVWLLALLAAGTYALIYLAALVYAICPIGRIGRAVNRQQIGQIED